ncbi:MAG TPA: Asp-tRNA(Asn)/Glu-tRNA(Gln) amidotransferase subunit GatA, partial [Pyrodictiaceae archaeon]|nr:Asp-tRNA(Asn)/Glu-tRNA(Gln) amidotransferase subunit GatA [Pyrodictiaceae archaeon]
MVYVCSSINAYIYINENLLKESEKKDEKLAKLSQDEIPELFGIPIAIKDNICTLNMPTTCASKMLENFISPYDATVVRRLKDKGALILGKTNLDEFAFGSSTETSFFGPTKNPWDLERVPGGSSGGSAAAVSAKEAVAALGSDTGGSIRQPASFCGDVGLKPTYGRVSRYGLVAFASSLDQIGPLTKNVKDSAFLLEIIAGIDNKDSTNVDYPIENYVENLRSDIKGLKIGYDENLLKDAQEEIKNNFFEMLKILERLGCEIIKITELKDGTLTYHYRALPVPKLKNNYEALPKIE